jgi:hypothetical protein
MIEERAAYDDLTEQLEDITACFNRLRAWPDSDCKLWTASAYDNKLIDIYRKRFVMKENAHLDALEINARKGPRKPRYVTSYADDDGVAFTVTK